MPRRENFIEYWVDQNMLAMDTATRIFTVLKQPDKNFLRQVRLFPPIPGLYSATLVGVWYVLMLMSPYELCAGGL